MKDMKEKEMKKKGYMEAKKTVSVKTPKGKATAMKKGKC